MSADREPADAPRTDAPRTDATPVAAGPASHDGDAASVDVLAELRSGRREALDQLVPVVYTELRAIAHRQLARRGHRATLATTALVNEVYLKLVDQSRAGWRDRA